MTGERHARGKNSRKKACIEKNTAEWKQNLVCMSVLLGLILVLGLYLEEVNAFEMPVAEEYQMDMLKEQRTEEQKSSEDYETKKDKDEEINVHEKQSTEDDLTGIMEEELIGEMELDQVQNLLDELLGDKSFSFTDAIQKILSGEELLSKETVQEMLRSLFFSGIEQEKDTFFRLLLLILIAAVFSNFVDVFDGGQIGEVSFYMVYLLLFMMVAEDFSALSTSLAEKLNWLTRFMQGLSPAYYLSVAAASGASSAAVFYQGVLVLVWLLQWVVTALFLPGANLYILLKLVNHLSREEMLSKMAELLETIIGWGLKTLLGIAVGLQVVKGLVAPVIDSLKRTALGRTATLIPGIGNAVNTVTELVLTSAVLVRNSLGVAALIALVMAGIGPAIHYGMLSLVYRFLAAVSQPVSDKRIVGALSTMGEGCALLLRILLTAEVLCMITFLILAASFGGRL